MPDAPRRGDRSGASLASEQSGTGEGQRLMAQPHTRSPVVGGKPDWESQPGRSTWNLTAIPRRMERSAKGIAGWILAKVNGVGPQASLQQEASPGQHAHQRGDSSRRFRSYFLATNMRASIKCHCSANICWCAALHACLTFFYDASPTWKGFQCFGHHITSTGRPVANG